MAIFEFKCNTCSATMIDKTGKTAVWLGFFKLYHDSGSSSRGAALVLPILQLIFFVVAVQID